VSLLEQMNMSPAQATEMFIKLRDTKKAKDEEHKKSVSKLVAAMDKLEGALLEFLDANGVQNVACAAGTAYKSVQLSATIEDKEAFMSFVKETEQWEALDIKANKSFVNDYLDENQEAPPGVKTSKISTVGVQRK
jgi:type I site-specific restriction endonuclease